jgi:uncharacterized membrane protein YbhN (UPF0104 family)
MEVALVAALTAVGPLTEPVVAAVLLFRLATFWLPLIAGWIAARRFHATARLGEKVRPRNTN